MDFDVSSKQAWKRRSMEPFSDNSPWTKKEYDLLFSAVAVFAMVLVLVAIVLFAAVRAAINA